MTRTNPLRLAFLSLALLGSVASVARAHSDGRDGPNLRDLRQEAALGQAFTAHPAVVAQGKAGSITDAGMGVGPTWGAGVYDRTDIYRDPVTGIALPGTSSESIN